MFGCSGPRASAAIAKSVEIGYTHAAVYAGMAVASVALYAASGRRAGGFPLALLAFLAVHPAWTISVVDGDCGFLRRDASYLLTGFGVLLLVGQVAFVAVALVRAAHRAAGGDYDEGPAGSRPDGRGP